MSKIFAPNRCLGYVSNHIPLQVRYIKSRKENLISTCVGKTFHTYGISHFGLLSVSGLHHDEITCMASDTYHTYTACDKLVYAWRRGRELKATYVGHNAKVKFLLPFGIHLISIDVDGCMKVWDIKTQELYLEIKFNYAVFEISAILHPSTYINKILLGSAKGDMQLWNINTSKMIYSFDGWDSPISCLVQAPAIDVVAVGLDNGRIILHNIKYDETIVEFHQDWGCVTSLSFRLDDSATMVSGTPQGHLIFWDLEEKRVGNQIINAHSDSVTGLVCLPSEPLMLTSSPDNTLRLWVFDMSDGSARLLRYREGHSCAPSFIRFHGSDGANLLSVAGDSSMRIFNTKNEQFNKSLGKASYHRERSKKRGLRGADDLIMPPIVGFASETAREKQWENIAAIHRDLGLVTTWSYQKVKMGDKKLLPSRLSLKANKTKHDDVATCVCVTHCGNFVVIGYGSGYVERFNIQSGQWRGSYGDPLAHSTAVRGVATDLINQFVMSAGADGLIKFWRFAPGTDAFHTLKLNEAVSFIRAQRESALVALAMEDFTLEVLDLDTKRIVRKFEGHTAQITDVAFTQDARWLISAGMDCAIRTWNIPSAHLIDQFRSDTACISLDFSPSGEYLITAHVDYMGVFLWCNRAIFEHVTFKAVDFIEEPSLIALPQCHTVEVTYDFKDDGDDEDEFKSAEQIDTLITMSGLATSRWLNLLNIDVIRRRNKPKNAPKVAEVAPFFLPTTQALDPQFDFSKDLDAANKPKKGINHFGDVGLSDFGRLLHQTKDYQPVVTKLKSMGPSMVDLEIKSLDMIVMLKFMECIEFMLTSNRDFELAQAYLSVFLKNHGTAVAENEHLRAFLENLQNCSAAAWSRLQEKFMYTLCVLQNIKSQI